MAYLKIKTMAQPPSFDWGSFTGIFTICATILAGFWKWVDASHKLKKEENKAFIEGIVESSVKKTLDAVLGDIRSDIQVLFKYREDDRRHYDVRFDSVIKEIKK